VFLVTDTQGMKSEKELFLRQAMSTFVYISMGSYCVVFKTIQQGRGFPEILEMLVGRSRYDFNPYCQGYLPVRIKPAYMYWIILSGNFYEEIRK
jgi:hypothetical protein